MRAPRWSLCVYLFWFFARATIMDMDYLAVVGETRQVSSPVFPRSMPQYQQVVTLWHAVRRDGDMVQAVTVCGGTYQQRDSESWHQWDAVHLYQRCQACAAEAGGLMVVADGTLFRPPRR